MGNDRAAQAAVLAMKAADRDLKRDINRATREEMNPVWRSLVSANATRPIDARVLGKGARIAAGNPPQAIAASSTRALSGGLIPADRWHPFEFGSHPEKVSTYTRTSTRGTRHTVTRHTRRQFRRRNPKGQVIMPAFAQIAPRMVSLWVQLIVRKYHEAAEGR